jgi:hypothetical protein
MHPYIATLGTAIKNDPSLKHLLTMPAGTPDDSGASIVTSLIYPQLATIGINGHAVFRAAKPEPGPAREAAAHFAERVHQPNLSEMLGYSHRFLTRRPECSVTVATGLIGWLAANDPANAAQRYGLFGTYASDEAAQLASALRDHEILRPLEASLTSVYLDGSLLAPEDFRSDERNKRDAAERERVERLREKERALRSREKEVLNGHVRSHRT